MKWHERVLVKRVETVFKQCAAILGKDTKQDILQNKTSSSLSVQGYLALGE